MIGLIREAIWLLTTGHRALRALIEGLGDTEPW